MVSPFGSDNCNGTLVRLRVELDGTAMGGLITGFAFMRLRGQRRYLVNPDDTELDTHGMKRWPGTAGGRSTANPGYSGSA